MNMMTPNPTAGETARASQLFKLARQFHEGAEKLFAIKGQVVPARLLALQAIEGYLIAFTRHHGQESHDVRCANHDLVKLADMATAHGLAIMTRSHVHFDRITSSREYLNVRYGPEQKLKLSEPSALRATMTELREKVGKALSIPVQP